MCCSDSGTEYWGIRVAVRPARAASSPYLDLAKLEGARTYETQHPSPLKDGALAGRDQDFVVHQPAPVYAAADDSAAPLALLRPQAVVTVVERKTVGPSSCVWFKVLAKREALQAAKPGSGLDWLDGSDTTQRPTSQRLFGFSAAAASPSRLTHVWVQEVLPGPKVGLASSRLPVWFGFRQSTLIVVG